ncbi:hypothetical protein PSTT_00782 [Puccinia striiformis]|uniref:Uncharacterized protein n=1 Tax=Puccinia striiformis TaxID=27350 RepID=A0A2S4W5C7_9BASI|nr:hypothetical protein PSTT_00782 [Puccinia striiformis]
MIFQKPPTPDNQGDWARFFPIIALLQSTSDHSSKGGPPISFAGFAVEDAKILLELDFKAPPTSQCFAITWDTPKKKLAKHLVTKMNEMRRAQGYPSLILDTHYRSAHYQSLP